MEIADLLTVAVTLLGSLGTTVPILMRFKTKVSQARVFIATIEDALEDDKITAAEMKLIIRTARIMVGREGGTAPA